VGGEWVAVAAGLVSAARGAVCWTWGGMVMDVEIGGDR
jgi:hypothetical protein